jgi:hypothetical protein
MNRPAEQMQHAALTERLRFCDSYSRLPTLVDLYFETGGSDEWWRQLGECWTVCDNIGAYKQFLAPLLAHATPHQRTLMMTADEQAALAELPPVLTVYRGGYALNRTGLSWSLSRDVAAGFPFLGRYARHLLGEQPLLMTGRVRRDRCVLQQGRDESEIIAPRVRIIDTEWLEVPA